MIDISLGKLVLLALIGLIVLGPEKLPEVARTAGALLRRVRHGWDSVRAEVERELEIEQIRKTAREAAARAEAAQAELDATTKQIRDPFQRAADTMRQAGSPPAAERLIETDDVMRPLTAQNPPTTPEPAKPVPPVAGDAPHGG